MDLNQTAAPVLTPTLLSGWFAPGFMAAQPETAGAEDAAAPLAETEFLAARAPGARAEIIDDVGHLAPAEAPEHTAHLLKERFLD